MTTYQGGKKRLGKSIYEIINQLELDLTGSNDLPYFEPFVGMAGILHFFARERPNVYASDVNEDLILLWRAIQRGWKPPLECSRKEYEALKKSKRHSAKRGFIGIVASWGGMFFGPYRLDYVKGDKNFLREGYNGLMKIRDDIKNVSFLDACSYDSYNPKGALIYCDPPYHNNGLKTGYFQNFDHEAFWETMRRWSKHNIVVISEITAPSDFVKLYTFDSTLATSHYTKKYEESLFIHQSILSTKH